MSSLNREQWRLTSIVLILLAGAVVYSNTLHVPFFMDDHYLNYYEHRTLGDILLHGGSRRVTDLTFALNYRLHGMQPAGFHLVNLSIHLAAAVSLFFLTSSLIAALRLSPSPGTETEPSESAAERFIPLTVALLFTLHPAQTQAVTYIIQRYTSLATLFYLLSVLWFVRVRLMMERSEPHLRVLLAGGSAFAAGLLAIGSKQIAATLPGILIVIEIVVFRSRMLNRRFFLGCLAAITLALAAGAVHWWGSSPDEILLDLHLATAEDPHMSRAAYFLTQIRVVATYLRLFLLPYGQSLLHDPPVYRTLFTAPVVLSLCLHLGLIGAALALFRRSGRLPAGSNREEWLLLRLTALGIAWFYGTMAVESSIFPIRDLMFEHRLYLPSIGFFISIAAGTTLLFHTRSLNGSVVCGGVALVCILLGGATYARNQVWNSRLALWQDTARQHPQSALALANLGAAYLDEGMPGKALPLLVKALEIKPILDAKSKVCIGKTLRGLNIDKKRFTTGEEFVRPGAAMLIGGPGYGTLAEWESVLANNMALAYEYLGEVSKALDSAGVAVWLRPSYDKAWYNLGIIALRTGNMAAAGDALSRLKELNPGLAKDLEAARK